MAVATATVNSTLPFRVADFETLTEGLDYAAGGETGISFYSPRGELETALTYAELREQAMSMALKLVAAGYPRGMRFAIVAETHPYFHIFFFACQYAGLIPVPLPLNMNMGAHDAYVARLRGMIRESGCGAVVAREEMLVFLREAASGLDIDVGTPEDFAAGPESQGDLRPFDGEGPCYIQYSSGSTSAPRGVFITQKAITSNARGISRHGLKVEQGDRSTSWLPLYHDMGLVGFCIAPIMSQVTVDYLATASFARRPLVWLKLMSKTGGTISFGPTFGYDLCARRGLNGSASELDLSNWRIAGVGGEMVRAEALESFATTFGEVGFSKTAFLPSYGLAEACLGVCFPEVGSGVEVDRIDKRIFAATGRAVPLQDNDEDKPGLAFMKDPSSAQGRDFVVCGRPLPGHKIEIRDDHENPLGERSVGRVMVKGPSVMAGYFEKPSLTAAAMTVDGWLDTGDLGYLIDGKLVITGRRKDLIIHNGRNIWPQDIEWALEGVDQIRSGDAACFAVETDDDDCDNEVVAVVQCRSSDRDVQDELVREIGATVYRASGLNCRVVLVPTRSLTFTSSGKLSRAAVKADYLAGVLNVLNESSGALPATQSVAPARTLRASES
jgi:fatty-acyl-CoA synthase